MQITLNGTPSEVPEAASIRELVEGKQMPSQALVAELNGEIVAAEDWEGTRLKPEDSLVLVRLVGGG